MDCNDNSDEKNCRLIDIDQDSYHKEVPPTSLWPHSRDNGKIQLLTDIKILNILALNEVKSLVSLQLLIKIQWLDSRIKFLNLKKTDYLNVVSFEEMNKIWMPTLLFSNTKSKQGTNLRNQSSFVTVEPLKGMYRFS